MNVGLSAIQFWALAVGEPAVMVFIVLVGILINTAVTKSHLDRLEDTLRSEMQRIEDQINSPFVRK